MSNFYQLKSHPSRILYDHLGCVGLSTQGKIEDVYSNISTSISGKDLSRAALILGSTHDIGKGTTFFQRYLDHEDVEPLLKSHSLISSLYCSWAILNDLEISDNARSFLAIASSLVIQGHHGSLKNPIRYFITLNDFRSKKIFQRQILAFERIDELEQISQALGLRSFLKFRESWFSHFSDFHNRIIGFYKLIVKKQVKDTTELYFLINLLYSALLDADRRDAARIGPLPEREKVEIDTVKDYVKTLESDSSDILKKFRKVLFENVQRESKTVGLDQRIFTLTAPTGLGKTLSSINFALNLRKRIELEKCYRPRIIYVAPFISILDQNWQVLQKVFQGHKQKTVDEKTREHQYQTNLLLMHHHLSPINYSRTKNADDEQVKEGYSTSQSELLIQGWNAEIVVTTFIQFFDTIFGRYTSQLRRFSNIIGSIVILDEVQSIPFEYWSAIRNALLFLSKEFQFNVILMTATQPLIFKKDEAKEIAPVGILNTLPPRVTFDSRITNAMDINEFCSEINQILENHQTKSILIEMNTISSTRQVYESVTNPINVHRNTQNVFFLSSHIIPKHRRPRIDLIKEKLENLEPLILISTQVIEAGVDLDFNTVVRDIGPIDSIVQTAGRCNRNGNRTATESPFYIYRVVDEKGHELAQKVYGYVSISITNSLIPDNKNTNLIDLVQSYYKVAQGRFSSEASDVINAAISELDYERVDNKFELIDDHFKVPVFVEYDQNAINVWKRFVNLLSEGSRKPSRNEVIQIRHDMEQYMIAVSRKQVDAARLEDVSGIYRISYRNIGHFYNQITGFIPPP